MPARKPAGLLDSAETKENRKKRTDAESALRPTTKLTQAVPVALKGHAIASAIWKHMVKLYGELEAEIVSSLDRDMLTDYCILEEQLGELDQLRKNAYKDWGQAQAAVNKIKPRADNLEDWARAQGRVNDLFGLIIKLDGRADRKRSLLLQFRQSLYLTPRSRSGVNPGEKPEEEPDALKEFDN